MDIRRSINVIDTHTECDLCRIIVGGIGLSTLCERISEGVDRIFANRTSPVQKSKTGYHYPDGSLAGSPPVAPRLFTRFVHPAR